MAVLVEYLDLKKIEILFMTAFLHPLCWCFRYRSRDRGSLGKRFSLKNLIDTLSLLEEVMNEEVSMIGALIIKEW